MVTIYDIAKETGLSASTVSRALSGNGYVSEKSAKKIRDVAEMLGYIPNQTARTMRSNITNKIMLCIPDIMNPYYFAMIKEVTEALEGYGYNVLLTYTMHNPEKELEILRSLRGGYVDGLIFGSFNYTDELIEAIRETELPTVITSYYSSEANDDFYDSIYVDQAEAAYIATKYCIENGHKRIAFLGGDPAEQNTTDRYKGYERALLEAGISLDKNLIIEADFTREGAEVEFKKFIQSGHELTAVLACNDLMGVGCMNACKSEGLSVPYDISIVSLDNTEYSVSTNPQMTSVDMMQGQVGAISVKAVMDRIRNNRKYRKDLIFYPNLVVRESVKTIN